MKTSLTLFQRYDKAGQLIPSQQVLRKSKPKQGSWVAVSEQNLCCNPIVVVTATPSGSFVASTGHSLLTIKCGSATLFSKNYTNSTTEALTLTAIAVDLDTNNAAIATFTATSTTLVATAPVCSNLAITIVMS